MSKVIEKIESKLNEVTTGRVDFSITRVGRQALVKIVMGVFDDTSIKELQQAERKLIQTQAKMDKEIQSWSKKIRNDWRTEPQKVVWVSQNADFPVQTPLLAKTYITVHNISGLDDTNTLYEILHKFRG